ncbi:unnamed protein product [Protopolystoma xenopodis]|uniref:Uncharacterized protein n=1 Tax=Protopolystoma xenopodis TaxID=117903 RepID=A0A3S4ZNQ2_9PLAT|nr:unnamed protein product [Protopolystoma xenopodis]
MPLSEIGEEGPECCERINTLCLFLSKNETILDCLSLTDLRGRVCNALMGTSFFPVHSNLAPWMHLVICIRITFSCFIPGLACGVKFTGPSQIALTFA